MAARFWFSRLCFDHVLKDGCVEAPCGDVRALLRVLSRGRGGMERHQSH